MQATKINKTERDVLSVIDLHCDKEGYFRFSNEFIAKRVERSPRVVRQYLTSLERKKYIKRGFEDSSKMAKRKHIIRLKRHSVQVAENSHILYYCSYSYGTTFVSGPRPGGDKGLVAKKKEKEKETVLLSPYPSPKCGNVPPVPSSNPRHSPTPSPILAEGLNPTPRPGSSLSCDFNIFDYPLKNESMPKKKEISEFYKKNFYFPEEIPALSLDRKRFDTFESLRTLTKPEILYIVRHSCVKPSPKQVMEQVESLISWMRKPGHESKAKKEERSPFNYFYLIWLPRAKEKGYLYSYNEEGFMMPDGEWSNGNGTHTIVTNSRFSRQEATYVDEDYEAIVDEEYRQRNVQWAINKINKNQDENIEGNREGVSGLGVERVSSSQVFKEA